MKIKSNKLWQTRSRLYRSQNLQVNILNNKYSLESSWRDLQDLHAFAPLRPEYFRKFSSNFFAFSTWEMIKTFDFYQISSWFSLILMKFARLFSDFLEKRCNYSKCLDSNLILSWSHLIFDLIFDLILFNFTFNFHIGTTPERARRTTSRHWVQSKFGK